MQVTLLYGLLSTLPHDSSLARNVIEYQLLFADNIGGVPGLFFAILFCSSFLPTMMRKGTLDLLLARPVSRRTVILAKFIGGLWYTFFLATVMVTGLWLALSVRSGYYNPLFLGCIFTLVLTFAVLYGFSLFFTILTESGLLGALVAIGVWFVSSGVVTSYHSMHSPAAAEHWAKYPNDRPAEWVLTAVEICYWIVPKTQDLSYFNRAIVSQAYVSEMFYKKVIAPGLPEVNWSFSLGTTLAIFAFMLAMTVYSFCRRDY
jgi:ABC-type transport system involved in multi-copper enzyme maturation permease subunit